MARIKVFNKEYLTKELGLPYDCKLIEDDIIDTTRWSIVHEIVFEDKGKFYRTTYSVGATEMQWENRGNMRKKWNVKKLSFEVTVKKWIPVEEQGE